eukprot:350862-Prymnesium_polylepis.1
MAISRSSGGWSSGCGRSVDGSGVWGPCLSRGHVYTLSRIGECFKRTPTPGAGRHTRRCEQYRSHT